MAEKNEKTIGKQIVLPMMKSVRMSMQSIRLRLGRSMITVAGIVLALAFVMAVTTSIIVEGELSEKGPADVRASLAAGAGSNARQVWLVSLSLLVCLVGITNSMLMSVTERYREIGTMKCLGALDSFVVRLFLIESAFQGLIGSISGVLIGLLAMLAVLAARYGGIVFSVISWGRIFSSIVLALVIGMVLSVVAAIYPAYRAAKMVPADAMRKEE